MPRVDSPNFESPEETESGRKFPLPLVLGGVLLASVAAGALYYFFSGRSSGNRPDLILHTVRHENLDLTVIERGTLESANNQDIICRVKAGSKGNYASTIRWVIDDGTVVRKGQPIMHLDSSALEDQYRAQRIELEQAQAALVKAEQDFKIVVSTNESDIEAAKVAISLAELDLEKYVGLPRNTISGPKREQVRPMLLEMEANLESFLIRYRDQFPGSDGEFQKNLDELSGKVSLAEADVAMWKDRYAYSQRMQLKKFLSAAQVQADKSRMDGAEETLKQYKAEKQLLLKFTAQRLVKDLSAKVQEAWRAYDRKVNEATAKEVQAEAERRTKRSVFVQQEEKLRDIEDQLEECKIHAPQDGMVVYYIPESSRFSSSERGLIQQGASVQEGQKLMRIPDLKRMQVATRVHEAMVSRIRGDDRRSTGISESVRVGRMLNTSALMGLFTQQEDAMEREREQFRHLEYRDFARGQDATIRVDAHAERAMKGHVRTVATVASSSDFMSSDVKVYQTVVAIDDGVEGLRPGMSAEVTIHVNNTIENVLAIPVQAVIGGAESGSTRKVLVLAGGEVVEREVRLGLSNERMAEVREGLQAGDQVVVNPKVVVGSAAKTREDMPETQTKGKGKGKGGPGGPPGGSPGGGPPGGGKSKAL